MGRRYSTELEELDDTYAWGIRTELNSLSHAVETTPRGEAPIVRLRGRNGPNANRSSSAKADVQPKAFRRDFQSHG